MATTSIWAVKSRVDHVLDYATNEQKTDRRWSEPDLQAMRDVMDYAMNDAKTEKQFYITALQCSLRDARTEMALLKRRHGKEDGILAFHGYQSFKPGEVTPDIAHEIGVKLAEELWPDHQVIVATHLDKAHVHNHFVLNSVSMNGRKFYANKESYRKMRAASDRLCKQYGLSVITDHKEYYPKHYAEWSAEQDGQSTWRSSIRVDMDAAIKASMTFQQFIIAMKQKGYVLERRGSFLRIKSPGMKRFVRFRSLGEGYSETDIQRRILQKRYPEMPTQKVSLPSAKYTVQGDFRLSKVTWKGLRALYFFYVRKLRQARQQPREAIPDALRVDLRHLDAISEQSKFLNRYKLDTGEQVESLKLNLEMQLFDLQKERKMLCNEKRRQGITDDRTNVIHAQLKQLKSTFRQVRRDLKLCDIVLERSKLRSADNTTLTENNQYELKDNTIKEQTI